MESKTYQGEQSIKLFPNPNDGTFTLTMSDIEAPMIHLDIWDLSGRLIANESLLNVKERTQHIVHFEDINPGVYLLTLRTETDQLLIKRLIIE